MHVWMGVWVDGWVGECVGGWIELCRLRATSHWYTSKVDALAIFSANALFKPPL